MNDTLAARATTSSAAVRLRVVYLARLREAFGSSGESLVLDDRSTASVHEVLEQLRARGGAFARELAPGRTFRVAVNHAMAAQDTVVCDGDEVALLPPVTGG